MYNITQECNTNICQNSSNRNSQCNRS